MAGTVQEKATTQEIISEGLDFFTRPGVMLSEEHCYSYLLSPMTSVSNFAPLIYEIDVDTNHYCDLSQCFHYVRYKIVKSDGENITAPAGDAAPTDDHKVAPINLYGSTFFQNVELYLNSHLVETSNNLYPYKSYMQTFLSSDRETKKTQLELCGFYEDIADIDSDPIRASMSAANCANKGLLSRYKLSKNSTAFSSLSPVHLDICSQGKYIQNKTNIKIRFTRASPKFALIANSEDKNFQYVIDKAFLIVRMVQPRESLRLAVEQTLALQPALYPFKQTELRFFSFSQNTTSICEPNLYAGPLPTRVCLGLVKNRALTGHYKDSPLKFEHFDMQEIDLRANGKSITTDPIKIDMTNNESALAYFYMYQGTGGFLKNENIVSYSAYRKAGNFLIVFDLTQDGQHGLDEFHSISSGTLSVDIRLKEAADEGLALVCMLEFEAVMTCDMNRHYNIEK